MTSDVSVWFEELRVGDVSKILCPGANFFPIGNFSAFGSRIAAITPDREFFA